jgi:hypothetical protein
MKDNLKKECEKAAKELLKDPVIADAFTNGRTDFRTPEEIERQVLAAEERARKRLNIGTE